MRTLAGDYATVYYPSQYIYSEDVCNIFFKQQAGVTVTGYELSITYSSVSPSGYSKSVSVRLTPDAEGNTFVDISPYNRAMVTECAGTLARLTLTVLVVVRIEGDSETLGLQTLTLEPGTCRLLYTSTTAGEAVQPPKQVMVYADSIALRVDLQNTSGAGKLQWCTAGVWTNIATLNLSTGVDSQIKPYVTANVVIVDACKQLRVVNYRGDTVWQGQAISVYEACSADKWAWVEWRTDQWLNKKSWLFKIKQITRKVMETQDLAMQPFVYNTTPFHETTEANERNGQGYNRQKNWQISMQVVVDGLTEREMMYFQDLFTSPEVRVKTLATGRYGEYNLNKVQAAVDGNSITTAFKLERGSLTFNLLIADFKQY